MIKIVNWPSFQSYKDRKPPWIRLHKSLLDNYEFHKMSANSRALLPMLWLLASEDEDPVSGSIRYGYEKISFRLRLPIKDIKSAIEELAKPNEEGEAFIQIIPQCNGTVTEPLQNGRESVTPETETETEKRQRKSGRFAPPSFDDVSQYCKERKNNIDPQAFVDFYSSKGWKVGNTPMKDWQAAVRTWEKRQTATIPDKPISRKECICGKPAIHQYDNEHLCQKCFDKK